ncbi:L,D-transpeptidase family protein [Paracoccus spongiarum]|uniref:L,D-transpeptidase family protein n=1 Tax=Paracoccus spongiarum TaxID=3064387 RepID=A0ABT9JEP6_9RHOB|nr:L,D-transpeptidase family protein [Paracoccus sp. 2205BS29-5]MDP5308115.1 L,D-transpeptidase family protein [Paracoccus sp. 2205BS29-5]
MRRISLFALFALGLASVIPLSATGQTFGPAGRAAGAALAPQLHFSAAEMLLAEAVADSPDLAAFYGGNGLRPVFQGPQAEPLRAALRGIGAEAPRHAIPAARYQPDELARAGQGLEAELLHARVLLRYLRDMTGGMIRPQDVAPQIHRQVQRPPAADLIRGFLDAADPAAYLAGMAPRHPAYLALQKALSGDAGLTVPAHLPRAPEALWRVGMAGAGVVPLRQRLAAIGFDAPAADPGDYDAALSEAVARYQAAAGLPADGVAGPQTIRRLNGDEAGRDDRRSRMIAVALERMRWMGGEDLQARHIWVNIPEFRARIFDGGQQVFDTRVVVGKTAGDLQTPEFSDQMEHLVVNPRWNVPRSITVKEYLPLLKANRNAVSHLDIIDSRGRVVPRASIDFSRYTAASFPYRMQQKPSDDNALGLVKFIFPNPWNIYLHDTPTKHLFGNRVRAYSHGCVRVGDPFDLAAEILSQQSDDPRAMFQRALSGGRETWLALTPKLPVHLVYFTAFPDETGQIRFHDDIYGRDAALWRQLAAVGLELGGGKD